MKVIKNIFTTKKTLFALLLFFAIIATVITLYGYLVKNSFSKEITRCNRSSSNTRFSCYRNAIETHYKNNIQGLLSAIKNEKELVFEDLKKDTPDISYAVFGTNCHSFYHSVGDFIATTSDQDLNTKIKMCSASCTSGCIMGLFKRTALESKFENSTLEKFYPDCPDDMKHQCAHEVGHVLHDKYTTSILGVIDPITEKKFNLAPKKTYSYITNKNPDLNAPFEDCKKLVPESELAYCYTGVGHNLFLFSEFSKDGYKQSIAECSTTDESHKGDCYSFLVYRIGINNAATKFLSKKYDEGISLCSDITKTIGKPDLEKHCYLGIGGGIGLFIDSEFAGRDINDKNFSAMRAKIYEQIYSCDKAPEKFQKDCYTGLLGTPVRKLYKTFNLEIDMIENILPTIDNGFQVVG